MNMTLYQRIRFLPVLYTVPNLSKHSQTIEAGNLSVLDGMGFIKLLDKGGVCLCDFPSPCPLHSSSLISVCC